MKRLLIVVLLAALAATAAVVGSRRDSPQGSDATATAAAEAEAGGPSRPADYLTLKWTSGRDVTPAQVARAERQAGAIPQQLRCVPGSGFASRKPGSSVKLKPSVPMALVIPSAGKGGDGEFCT